MTTQHCFINSLRRWGLLGGLTLAVAQLFIGAGLGTARAATTNCTPKGAGQECTVTFAYTGAAENWTVPEGVTQATFDLYGAQGVGDLGGQGGRVTATLNVTQGTTYQILSGGQHGFNGGGSSLSIGSGGGASDVRSGAFTLTDRLLVAGGGGGGGGDDRAKADGRGMGGAGGYPNGGYGDSAVLANNDRLDGAMLGGRGGTQSAGGVGGTGYGALLRGSVSMEFTTDNGTAGRLGQGGNSGGLSGGGGGGYYGGGGGSYYRTYSMMLSFFIFHGAGGGGGSSYGPSGAIFQTGVRAGDGLVVITYTQSSTTAPTVAPTATPLPPPTPTATPVLRGGVVSVWGNNSFGQLSMPAGLSNVLKIATGYRHTLALKSDGTVVAWGYNAYGQSTVPSGLNGVIALAAGDRHSLALKGDGTVVAWGENSTGQLNIPAGLSTVVAIAAGPFHNLALKGDGTVVAWGSNSAGESTVPAGLNNVRALAAGLGFGVALKSDGTVVVWGDNTYKQLTMPAGLSGIKAIATGRLHTLALKQDNTVVAWGYTCCYQIAVPAGLNNVSALAGGGYHSLALKSDGTVVSWGDNTQGQRNLPAGLSGVAAISAGGLHTVLLSQLGGFQGLSPADAVAAAADAAVPNSEQPVMEEAPEAMGAVESSEPAPAATAAEAAPSQLPSENNGSNQIFLPIIANLAGTALGSPSGIIVLALIVVVMIGLVWQRRARKR